MSLANVRRAAAIARPTSAVAPRTKEESGLLEGERLSEGLVTIGAIRLRTIRSGMRG